MNKLMSKSVILMMLLFGVLFVATASDANAQDRCRSRSRTVSRDYYNDDNYYRNGNDRRRYNDDNYYRNVNDRRLSRDYYRDDYQDTTGKALKRTGIGAGIGALGGAVIGGKKGALIGAGIGAAGGYIYHRNKVNNQRDRYRY